MSKTSFRAAATALAGILIAIGGCAESPSSPSAPLQVVHRSSSVRFDVSGGGSSAVIDARGGSITTPAGQTLTFPAGALASPTQITVTDDPEVVGVEIQPHGLVFPAGRQPVLTLDPRGADVSGLNRTAVVYLNDATGQIEQVLTTSDLGGNRIRATLPHFSKYAYAGS
ncbi:hypothetical protein [Longimicrobium sp.]|uniref:hypothetical protein n=1 Tax=Longimicrobium sp. TaxID=2029185 RepID=UPI002BC6C432|nr:hypothetical protein [Longimicrobium sp.]HSU16799.1 hypothetical protein [Longimicrobium sp.]